MGHLSYATVRFLSTGLVNLNRMIWLAVPFFQPDTVGIFLAPVSVSGPTEKLITKRIVSGKASRSEMPNTQNTRVSVALNLMHRLDCFFKIGSEFREHGYGISPASGRI